MEYVEVLIELSPFSEESGEIAMALLDSIPFDTFELEEPYLKGYLPSKLFSEEQLKEVMELEGEGLPFKWSYSLEWPPVVNWNSEWESNFSPIVVGERCTVKATFHNDLPETEYTITIDPKMAFGTGHHQTTWLMLDSLLELEIEGERVLDMGCGTAILAILAALRGAASPIKAVDIDPDAVASAKENALLNGVEEKLIVVEGDESEIEKGAYTLILANITRNIIIEQFTSYSEGLVRGGKLLLSGFHREDVALLTMEGEKVGFKLLYMREKGNWAHLVLEKV